MIVFAAAAAGVALGAAVTAAVFLRRRARTAEAAHGTGDLLREALLAPAGARAPTEPDAALVREDAQALSPAALARGRSLPTDVRADEIPQLVVEGVAQLLHADAADCYLLDGERRVLRCVAVHGLPAALVGFEVPASRGLRGRAIESGAPASLGGGDIDDSALPDEPYTRFDDALVAPLRAADTSGTLGVAARRGRRFTREDADALEVYAGVAAFALAHARAVDAPAQQSHAGRAFFRIAAVLGQELSLDATLDAVADVARDALGAGGALILMPSAGELELAGSSNLPEPLRGAFARGLPQSAAVIASVGSAGRVLASGDLADDERFEREWTDVVARGGFRALLAVPVRSPREQANGVLVLFFGARRTFGDDDLELARHLADASRGALERSELLEAERTARALSQQLARTGGVLAAELDPAAVLDEVVQQAPALLGADACVIRTVEDEELVVAAGWGVGAQEAVGTRTSVTSWLSGDVFQSRAPLAVDDAGADERFVSCDAALAAGYSGYLGVPLTGPEGTLHGVLSVYARRPRRWRPEEVEALLALAANTSAALSNAELYSRVSIEKERSDAILANIADGIVAVDRDGLVVLWNAAAEGITGIPAEEALGRTPAQVLQRTLESDLDHSQPGPRLVSIARGGEEVWLSLSEAVMRDPLGGVAGRIFAFRDISTDRMIEQVKSDFVAAVSHELRTPLTSIYGFAETLLRQDVLFGETERRTFISYIASESERLTGIVDQLLNVARLDAGDLQVEPEPVDVAAIASEVVETAEESGVVDGHNFALDLPAGPLAAEADREKLRQVVGILVENALKYSPPGGTVTVGARRKDGAVEVRVVDEGIGIPSAERERIFRKFYRAEGIARDGTGGTGLGLFIARELVTAMGGRIWVESAEGEGSSFAFELPAAHA